MLAIVSIGGTASVLRARGSHMLLALGGLILSCLFLGGAIGL